MAQLRKKFDVISAPAHPAFGGMPSPHGLDPPRREDLAQLLSGTFSIPARLVRASIFSSEARSGGWIAG